MQRYRLNKFLNEHVLLQRFIFVVIASLFTIYIVSYSLDLFNVLNTLVYNDERIKADNNLKEIYEYSLSGSKLTVNGKEYDNVNIVFFGLLIDDDLTYFDDSTCTLLQKLPKNFGLSFIISTNAIISFMSFLAITLLLYFLNNDSKEKLSSLNIAVCRLFLSFSLVLLVLILFTLLILL